jgi:hypothetical protein
VANDDSFYQSLPHAFDLGDDCSLIQDHIQYLLPAFLVLSVIVNGVPGEV